MMSGPGAIVSNAEVTRNSAMSGTVSSVVSVVSGVHRLVAPTKKPRYSRGSFAKRKEPSGFRRLDRHRRFVLGPVLGEFHLARDLREQRVVLADADALARV